MKSIKAWHFLQPDMRLGYGDGRLVETGQTLIVGGPVELCQHGLHASVDILDALAYARGLVLCRVVVGGEVLVGLDKVAGTTRKCLAMIDATPVVVEWAQWCAKRAKGYAAHAAAGYAAGYAAADAHAAAARAAAGYAARAAAAAAGYAAAAAAAAERRAQRRKLITLVNKAMKGTPQ